MQTIWNDPVDWTRKVVGTPLRIAFFAIILNGFLVAAIYLASVDGWRSAVGLGGMVALYQLMFLYVMRRMYVLLTMQNRGNAV